jgi:hypothetical protein
MIRYLENFFKFVESKTKKIPATKSTGKDTAMEPGKLGEWTTMAPLIWTS